MSKDDYRPTLRKVSGCRGGSKTGHLEPGYGVLQRSREMVSGSCPYFVVLQVCDSGIVLLKS